MPEEIKTNAVLPRDQRATAPVEQKSDPAAFSDRQRKKAVKAAETVTEEAKEENRLPESMAIANPAPATAKDMGPGGAFLEPEIRDAIPVDHPAVENNNREGTSAVQNGADYNDPFRDPDHPDFVGQGLDMSVYGGKKSR